MAQNNSNKKGNGPVNFIKIVLNVDTQKVDGNEVVGNVKYSAAGKPYGSFRGFHSQGKVKDGAWLPSMRFTVKAFSKSEEMSPDVALIGNLEKSQKVVVSGRLTLEEWTGNDGSKRQTWVILASKVEYAEVNAETAEPDPFA